jgi:hypothetical protein
MDEICKVWRQSYKTQFFVKLQKKMTFCNKLDSFITGKLLTCVIIALAKNCKITENKFYRIGSMIN